MYKKQLRNYTIANIQINGIRAVFSEKKGVLYLMMILYVPVFLYVGAFVAALIDILLLVLINIIWGSKSKISGFLLHNFEILYKSYIYITKQKYFHSMYRVRR